VAGLCGRAGRLAPQNGGVRPGQVRREYVALLCGCPAPPGEGGRLEGSIGPDPADARRMAALPLGDPAGHYAVSHCLCPPGAFKRP
jgi:hypothetical protein